MLALAFEEARIGERLVVLELQVRELDPHRRGAERAHVRREEPLRLVEVSAELLRVGDHLGSVGGGPALARASSAGVICFLGSPRGAVATPTTTRPRTRQATRRLTTPSYGDFVHSYFARQEAPVGRTREAGTDPPFRSLLAAGTPSTPRGSSLRWMGATTPRRTDRDWPSACLGCGG
jgi:hypothetical protein